MVSLNFELTAFDFDFEADRDILKASRASTRATNLHMKRVERVRARDARDWTWGKGIEGAKPHHAVRAAARTCLAQGAVETQEDMPSIVRMSSTTTKGTRRKPAIANAVHGAKVKVVDDLNDAETTADEGPDGFESESSQESPLCGPQDVPLELATVHGDWPALPLAAAGAPAAAAAEESRLSHHDVALRFVEESLEEQAAAERLRAKRGAAARAAREASMWKTSWSKRRQRAVKAMKAKRHARACAVTVQRRGDTQQGPAPAATSLDFEADLNEVKMARAAKRHRHLHAKRSELARARDARDWTWGRGIERAKPHHAIRAAARTCLAQGAVEAQEDMPSIVRMSKPGDKGTCRKPAIAHAVHGAKLRNDI
mmetsp:Transcript_18383/g.40198  ORF Transcript_18383/g.40198 Transcript_18383/m.40198 type:complete len:371 (+) Transcript_18383:97-1209(+)